MADEQDKGGGEGGKVLPFRPKPKPTARMATIQDGENGKPSSIWSGHQFLDWLSATTGQPRSKPEPIVTPPPKPMPPRPQTRLPAREFGLGGVEYHGEHVSLTHENGAFMVRRHPDHPAGHRVEGARTLGEARKLAQQMKNEAPKPSASWATRSSVHSGEGDGSNPKTDHLTPVKKSQESNMADQNPKPDHERLHTLYKAAKYALEIQKSEGEKPKDEKPKKYHTAECIEANDNSPREICICKGTTKKPSESQPTKKAEMCKSCGQTHTGACKEMEKSEPATIAGQPMTKAEQYRRELRGLAKNERAVEARKKNEEFWTKREQPFDAPGFIYEE